MANLAVLDATGATKYLKETGIGTDIDPHIGQVTSNPPVRVRVAMTISAAAYAAGEVVGGINTIANALRGTTDNALKAYLTNCMVEEIGGTQKAQLDIWIFDRSPAVGTFTDQVVMVFGTDIQYLLAHLTAYAADYTTAGGVSVADLDFSPRVIHSGSASRDLYFVVTCAGAPDFVNTTDLSVTFGFANF